jgi:hypothetical protein
MINKIQSEILPFSCEDEGAKGDEAHIISLWII